MEYESGVVDTTTVTTNPDVCCYRNDRQRGNPILMIRIQIQVCEFISRYLAYNSYIVCTEGRV